MRFGRLKAIAVKETIQIRRDTRSLVLALFLPFMQMILLGYGVSLDIKHLPICVYDREGSQNSQALLKHFQASDYFAIKANLHSFRDVKRDLDNDTCRMAIVVPHDFSERLSDTGTSTVEALADASDNNTATIAIGYAQAVVGTFSGNVQLDASGFGPAPPPAVSGVDLAERVWFNEDLDSRNFIIPGVVALIMALVGALLTSLTLSREWERGTMELLISTPVTPIEVMLGKLIPYFVIGMLDAVSCLVFAVFWFHVPFRGTLFTLFFTTGLFLIVVLGVGFLISASIHSQIGATQIAVLVTLLPTTMLSGYAFPIDQMPGPVQAVTYIVFARYYVEVLKALFLKGSSLLELARPVGAMFVYAAAIAYLSSRAFKKRLD
jgi:ABC-2 type transport system permease protein